jgi:hypothetical protein
VQVFGGLFLRNLLMLYQSILRVGESRGHFEGSKLRSSGRLCEIHAC